MNRLVNKLSERITFEKTFRYLFFLLFVFMLSPFNAGGGDYYLTRAILYFSLTFLVTLWLAISQLRREFPLRKTGLEFPISLFLIAVFLSFLSLSSTSSKLDGFFLFLSYFAIFYLGIALFKNYEESKFFLKILTSLGLFLVFVSLYQKNNQIDYLYDFFVRERLHLEVSQRAFAIFTNPNNFASLLILIIPLSLFLCLNGETKVERILFALAFFLLFLGLVLTFSRGGYISFTISLFIFLISVTFKKTNKGKVTKFLIFFSPIFLSFIITYFAFQPSFLKIFSLTLDSSVKHRLFLWLGAFKMISHNSLIGGGIGTFARLLPLYQFQGAYSRWSHNTYLQILAETGVIGGIGFLSLLFLIFLKGINLWSLKKRGKEYQLAIAFLASIVGFSFHNFNDSSLYIPAVGIVFWIILGQFASLSWLQEKTQPYRLIKVKGKLKERRLSAIPFLVGFLVFLFFFSSFRAELYGRRGRSFLKGGRIVEAKKLLEKAIQLNPINTRYKVDLAETYFRLGKSSNDPSFLYSSIYLLEKAVALDPLEPEYHLKLGIHYATAQRLNEAERELIMARSLYPNDPLYSLWLADFYDSIGREEEAIKAYSEGIKLLKYKEFWSGVVRNILNDVGGCFWGRGKIYLKRREYEKAKSDFENLLKISQKAEGYYYLSLAYLGLNEKVKAQENLEKALAINPNFKEAQEKLYQLKR